jgi:phenylalanyl-tRNA synthetase alpha chain
VTTDPAGEMAKLEAEATAALTLTADLASLEEAERVAFRSKRSRFAELYQQLGSMAPAQRRETGRLLNELRSRLEAIADARRIQLAAAARVQRLDADRLDLTEVLPGRLAGHLHLVTQVREALEDVFIGMGYEIAEGPEVETGWRNFEALNIPEDHPARSPLDTFYLACADKAP